jgi:hypothetical protein
MEGGEMHIVTADERLRERRGAKILMLGPSGVGKTWQLRTLSAEMLASTMLLDAEAGDLAILDLRIPRTIRLDEWSTARDVACRIGGPHKSFAATQCYSEAHYGAIGGPLEGLDQIHTLFIDSITAVMRLAFRHCEQQPEAYSERTGKKDVRGVYGLLAREMILWLNQLQHARDKNVILVGILERVVDDFNVATWQLQGEGGKTARELPGIVDEIITLNFLDFGDGKPPARGFVCTNPNPWGYPAKDRSGRLNQIEEPNLGKLLTKLTQTMENQNDQ